jgi:1-acyl-sn-glycerol-3-phosphate acyltransferase
VRRHERRNMVDAMAGEFSRRETLALVVPAEATRARAEHWKSGFYHIARVAQVPIVLGFLDYGRRRGGFGPELRPTGDLARDMDVVRSFYADKRGRHPEAFGPVRLREEDEARG